MNKKDFACWQTDKRAKTRLAPLVTAFPPNVRLTIAEQKVASSHELNMGAG